MATNEEEEVAPLLCIHQVKYMCAGSADGRSRTSEEGAEAEERQARAQVLTARKGEPKEAVVRMQMQQDAQVAACVDSTSRTVEVWGPTRQVLALALYVGETERTSRGPAGDWGLDTEIQRVREVMVMVDYGGARGRTKAHTTQVVSPKPSATGATDQGVTDLVQDGLTWWVVEPKGDTRAAMVYMAAPLKRVEHPLMRWGVEAEEVLMERAGGMRTGAILRALESQMGRSARTGRQRTSRSRSDWHSNGRPAARKGTNRG